MTGTIMYFDSEKDLEKLTGLSSEELWEAGFDLDDMDMGFVMEGLPTKRVEYDFWPGHFHDEVVLFGENGEEKVHPFIFKLLSDWENYCVGYHVVNYGGKQFVTLHHA